MYTIGEIRKKCESKMAELGSYEEDGFSRIANESKKDDDPCDLFYMFGSCRESKSRCEIAFMNGMFVWAEFTMSNHGGEMLP